MMVLSVLFRNPAASNDLRARLQTAAAAPGAFRVRQRQASDWATERDEPQQVFFEQELAIFDCRAGEDAACRGQIERTFVQFGEFESARPRQAAKDKVAPRKRALAPGRRARQSLHSAGRQGLDESDQTVYCSTRKRLDDAAMHIFMCVQNIDGAPPLKWHRSRRWRENSNSSRSRGWAT